MSAKEKAEDLVEKFRTDTRIFFQETGWQDHLPSAKNCALVTVIEIQNELENLSSGDYDAELTFWDNVAIEIKKL